MVACTAAAAAADMDWERVAGTLGAAAGTPSHPDRLMAVASEAVKELETVEGDSLAVEKLLYTWLCPSEFDLALAMVPQKSPSSMASVA